MDNEGLMQAGERLLTQNDNLREERDETRKWTLEIARYLKVEPDEAEKSVQGDWVLFRKKILEAIKVL